MQVAFKGAIDAGFILADDVKSNTANYYAALIDLHKEFDVDLNYEEKKSFGPKSAPKTEEEDVPTVIVNGELWRDYRKSERKQKNAKFPDFKTVDGKQSIWLSDREGNPTDAGVKFLEAVAG